MKSIVTAFLLACSLGIGNPDPNRAAAVAPEYQPFASGFTEPVSIANASDDRLFVVERAGRIRIVTESGTILEPPFLSIVGNVSSQQSEQGLLGLAFHPQYETNGWFYVNYTNLAGDSVVARFSVSADPDVADPDSEWIMLTVDQPYANHNGGDLKFGPDGYLYIFLGDGGSGGDPDNYAQNLQSMLGKILRIDVDSDVPYGIPGNNPFLSDPEALDEIWAYGLRNPWRVSFDRTTGDLWIADVGQSAREEINFQSATSPGGVSYGWRCYEGDLPYNTSGCDAPENHVFPVFSYAHPPHCAVTGGYVYRGSDYPGLYGRYWFTDYCTGYLWSLQPDGMGGFTETEYGQKVTFISSFGENSAGELFACSMLDGTLYRLIDSTAPTPTPTPTPTPDVTPTATPATCFVDLELSGTLFQAGDPFRLIFTAGNPEPGSISGHFWLLLDVFGLYWFYPGWTGIPGFTPIILDSGSVYGPETTLDFIWPEGIDSHASGLMFHAAITDAENSMLLSNAATVTFGY